MKSSIYDQFQLEYKIKKIKPTYQKKIKETKNK